MRIYSALPIAVFFSVFVAFGQAADPVAWLPAEINAVARINVSDLYKSSLAQKEGWVKKSTEAFIQQEAFVPPGTSQILVGAELELSKSLGTARKYSVLVPDNQMTLERLTSWLPGNLESVSGKTVANFGNDGFVADTGDGCWLTNGSSNRQALVRWLKNGKTQSGSQLPPYLRTALTSNENKGQAMMAIDLEDYFTETKVAEQLRATDWFKSESEILSVAKILESVQGITINLTIDDTRKGTATLDFSKDATLLGPILEKLVEMVLQRIGAGTEDVQDWKWMANGKRVTGTGPFTAGSGRRLLSVLDPPSITHSIPATASAAPPSKEELAVKTSHRYCKSLQTLLHDLRLELKSVNNNYTIYYEQYARKIDELPTLNVDPELLDFAGKVSSSLRYQSQNFRMNNIGRGTATASTYSNGYVGAYGTYPVTGAGPAITIGLQANQASKGVAFSEWKQIEDGLVVVRRRMTEKYQIQF